MVTLSRVESLQGPLPPHSARWRPHTPPSASPNNSAPPSAPAKSASRVSRDTQSSADNASHTTGVFAASAGDKGALDSTRRERKGARRGAPGRRARPESRGLSKLDRSRVERYNITTPLRQSERRHRPQAGILGVIACRRRAIKADLHKALHVLQWRKKKVSSIRTPSAQRAMTLTSQIASQPAELRT